MLKELDKFQDILQNAISEYNRVELLNEKAWGLRYSFPRKTVELALQAREISSTIDFKHGLAFSYLNSGAANNYLNQYQIGLEDLQKAFLLFKHLNDKNFMSITMRNIGNIYFSLNQFERALHQYNHALDIALQIDDKQNIAYIYNHIGKLKQKQGFYEEALVLHSKAYDVLDGLNDEVGIAGTLTHFGEAYFNMANYKESETNLLRSLELCNKTEHTRGAAVVCNVLGGLFSAIENHSQSIYYHQMAMASAHEINDKMLIVQFYHTIAKSYRKMGDYEKAFECMEFYDNLKSNLMDQNIEITLKSQQVEFQLKQSEIDNEIFKQKNEELERVNQLIKEKNKDITDSIKYAKHIQEAILTRKNYIDEFLPDWFIFYKSLDIVSGDFYWIKKKNGLIYTATVDCTGHGVPGAFISIVGSNLLNQILHEFNFTKANLFLDELNRKFNETIRQTIHESTVKDGMDISFCIIDEEKRIIDYAGANAKIFIKQDDDMITIRGSKQPIGIFVGEEMKPFQNHIIPYRDGDVLYMFSDGVCDQFGGAENKKLMSNRFKEFLLSTMGMKMPEQGKALREFFEQWRGSNDQIDDVMVLGIKL